MRGQTDSIKEHRALTTSKRTVRSAWGSPPEAGESPRSGLADAVIKSKCKARIRSKTLDMPALSDERLSDALWIVHGSDYNHFGTRRSLLPSRPTPGHHRPPARQDPSFHRLVAAAAEQGTGALCGFRRHPPARRVRSARCRPQEARPQRLGERGDGSADLAEDLRLSSRTGLGTVEDAGAQAEGARGADGSRRVARAGSARPRRSAWPRPEGRRGRRYRHPCADQPRTPRQSAFAAEGL